MSTLMISSAIAILEIFQFHLLTLMLDRNVALRKQSLMVLVVKKKQNRSQTSRKSKGGNETVSMRNVVG